MSEPLDIPAIRASLVGMETRYAHVIGQLLDELERTRAERDELLVVADVQRRRANWFEAAHAAGKTKLIEKAVHDVVEAIAEYLITDAGDDYESRCCATYWARNIRSGAWRKNEGSGE